MRKIPVTRQFFKTNSCHGDIFEKTKQVFKYSLGQGANKSLNLSFFHFVGWWGGEGRHRHPNTHTEKYI